MTGPIIPDTTPTTVTGDDLRAAAYQVFTLAELQEMPRPQLRSFAFLLRKRLAQPGPPPTKDELEGLKVLVTECLWHGALNKHVPGWW